MLKNSPSAPVNYPKKGLSRKILISCLLLIGVGMINSLWTQMDYKPWYDSLKKPLFSPPSSSLVGVIWTFMYISMGVSVGMVWQIAKSASIPENSRRAKKGIGLFLGQLLINMIVPIFFFATNNLYFLLTSVLINFLLVLGVIRLFYKINKTTAYILVPYAIWLFYAIVLDGSLLVLNEVV